MKTEIIYEGPSALDGQPIVVLAQTTSRNTKTGDMMQTFILRADMDPFEANRTGADESICGACPLKGIPHTGNRGQAHKRGCYVNLLFGPLSKFKVYRAGGYPICGDLVALGRGMKIRIGTYGDGMAVPQGVWDDLCSEAEGWTAYTHQWNFYPDRYMTSVETLGQAEQAWARGERTFRVVNDITEITKKEVLCPASEEAGKRTTCAKCGLCQGTKSRGKSIAIPAHGTSRGQVLAHLENSHENPSYETLPDQRHRVESLLLPGE